MLVAAREAKAQRFVYASSSSIYGDDPTLPKVEGITGEPLSPYAASKQANEMYADVFARCYGMARRCCSAPADRRHRRQEPVRDARARGDAGDVRDRSAHARDGADDANARPRCRS